MMSNETGILLQPLRSRPAAQDFRLRVRQHFGKRLAFLRAALGPRRHVAASLAAHPAIQAETAVSRSPNRPGIDDGANRDKAGTAAASCRGTDGPGRRGNLRNTLANRIEGSQCGITALRLKLFQHQVEERTDAGRVDEEIVKVLRDEVIKRDTVEGPEAEAAAKRVNRLEGKAMRKSLNEASPATPTPATDASSNPTTSNPKEV